MSKCPKCGNELGDWVFCNKCGTKVKEHIAPEPEKPFISSALAGQDILNRVSSNSTDFQNDKQNTSPSFRSNDSVVPPSFYERRNQNTVPKQPDSRLDNSAPQNNPKKTKTPLIIIASVFGVIVISAIVLAFVLFDKPQKNAVISDTTNSSTSSDDPVSDLSDYAVSEEKTEALSAQVEYETVKTIESASYFKNASASSVLPDQAGHQYVAENVLKNDGTCWVENASDYGEGEWIKLELPSLQKLSGLKIVNGYAGTEKQYDYNSKISEIRLDFSDGSSTNVGLKVFGTSERKTIQNISFSQPIETEYVKITIVSVTKGDCKDTCLTFVEPY